MKEIPLSGNLGKGKVAIVDDDVYDELSSSNPDGIKLYWSICNRKSKIYYVVYYDRERTRETGKSKIAYLHRLIMGFPTKGRVDHIDGNTLNNLRGNLRHGVVGINNVNKRKNMQCTSKYIGVHWYKTRSQWKSSISPMGLGKALCIGYYLDEEEAARNYDFHALKLHRGFARLNFPEWDQKDFVPKRIIDHQKYLEKVGTLC